MKKLFSMASVFLLALSLAGCVKEEELEVYEVSFTFTDEYQYSTEATISYNEDFEGSFQELIENDFAFTFSVSDYGTTLLSIEHCTPKTGAYVAISKNGELSSVGMDLLEFEDGDSFEFDVIWWDPVQKSVDDSIQLFMNNLASDYVNSESIDYNVLLGLELLGLTEEYISDTEIYSVFTEMDLITVNDYFKGIMLLQVAELSTHQYIEELNSIATPGPYGQTAFALLALDSYEHSVDYSAFVTSAIADFRANTPFELGLDAGGISLVAMSNYSDDIYVSSRIVDFYTWISESQLDNGGLKTRDVVWGETTYPGTENAASISQVIIGLIANGINPTNEAYTKTENNLVTRLIEFQTDTGSFDWAMGDEYTEDLLFSTPQAFLALVVYQTYANTYNAVNPYNFN